MAQAPLLDGTPLRVCGEVNAGQWTLTYGRTDRIRASVPVMAADTSHLYAMQLSRQFAPPRTMDGSVSETSTTWVDALDHPTVCMSDVRLAAFCLPCAKMLPRWTQESHWRTLVDAWPMGNGRCRKVGPSAQLCEVCWRMGHCDDLSRAHQLTLFRETTRHVRLDCRYAAAVVDTLARAVAHVEGYNVTDANALAAAFLTEVGAAMVTGHRGPGRSADGPFGALVAELSRELVERRQRSLGSGFPEWDPAATYMRVRASLEHVMQMSWREAEMDEKRMLLWLHELPEDDLPTDRWRREWARYFEECDSGMRLTLPLTREEVPGAEAATPSSGLVRVLVAVEARGSSVHVRFAIRETLAAIRVGELRAPERVLCNDPVSTRLDPPLPPVELLQRAEGVLSIYVDGSGAGSGGWGVVAVEGGHGGADDDATLRAEHYGSVTMDTLAPPFIGATTVTNSTAELTALAEGLYYLREVDGSTGPALLRPDSLYAADIARGLARGRVNRALASHVRSLWTEEAARRSGQLWAVHVRGHSGHRWGDRVDRAAARGADGFTRGFGLRWAAWPPLLPREPRAQEINETRRVVRAAHAFGVLAIPVPVHGETVPPARVAARLARIERRINSHSDSRARDALSRARAACRLLSNVTQQRAEADRLISAGLQPITTVLECPVNVRGLQQYVEHAGPEADVVHVSKQGTPQGTLREIAQRFLAQTADTVTLRYRHSLLGAELVAAGFVVASREYTYNCPSDPFRLPRTLRAIAFSEGGHDMDDAACYPRACLDIFRAGWDESSQFLAGDNRASIITAVASHFFGSRFTAAERKARMPRAYLTP